MKLTMFVHTDRVGSRVEWDIEVDDEEWAEMGPKERDEFMLDELWNSGKMEWGWREPE